MKVKTSNLIGTALDWVVAKCEGHDLNGPYACFDGAFCLREPDGSDGDVCPEYSSNWEDGGPIITEMLGQGLILQGDPEGDSGFECYASLPYRHIKFGPTPLVAAMRCYVASKLGDEIEIPEGLV